MNKRETGAEYEMLAAKHLVHNGLIIIEKNFRHKAGEIDLIAKDGDILVFVEVKYRHERPLVQPEYAVNFSKQKRICRVADMYMVIKKIPPLSLIRYDVIAIEGSEVRWHKNAFVHIKG